MYEIGDIRKTTCKKTPRKHITSQSVFIILMTLLISILGADTAPIQTKLQAFDYLSKFGYLLQASANPALEDDRTMTQAIEEFQSFEGASANGQLDNGTLQLMSLPRCGVEDTNNYEIDNRSKRYAFLGSRWPRKTLTYKILKYTLKLQKADIDAEISKAFKLWSDHADLTFIAIKETERADIQLQFVGSDNPNYNNRFGFNGSGEVVAVANPPISGGGIFFDDSEDWTIDSSSGENLLYTATHEIGHSLGLNHSDVISAVMSRYTRDFNPHLELNIDDILGIQALYGKKTIQSEICKNSTIDTIFNSYDGDTIVFKGHMYYKITNYAIAEGYPRTISEGWPGLPSDIDAAFTYQDKTYFFKGANYWRYSDHNIDSGYPKKISEDFPGIPDHLDAAMFWGSNGMIYFYKGSDVWRLNFTTQKAKRANISTWKGLPSDLDAALYTHGSTYFFKGDNYYRFNEITFAIYNDDPPYPRPSAHRWFGCNNVPSSFDLSDYGITNSDEAVIDMETNY